ncbi:HNH endonuclease [Reichenbachiella carrageenanivorans]|uniref:HNH endonuclease n=1 Tax=Reichenbachiella carrageenanivorans TaxID=2979869 RepID=A0ABY6CY80_9BACT|nr:HNH endonuclease [Reichenbachiella carrageenanivorans]UXX78871.1 HNH endonuclease [Reichenbachiella carrageenanivorans]
MLGKVLVLNQDYSPLTVCTIQRAFLLVFLGKAELIEASVSSKLRTVSKAYPLPAVIKVKNYVHVPYRGVVLTRQNIFKRDQGRCQYCGVDRDLTLDHLIPRSKGGKSTWNNLVTACKTCNAKKGNYSLAEAGLVLKRPPFKPSYIMFLRNNLGAMNKEWAPYLNATAVA